MDIITKYLSEDKQVTLTAYIQTPSREMACTARKPAVLILPGGAYLFTSDREAEPIALAYAARGFQAFVLHYSTGKRAVGMKPLKEASAAIGLIRENAEQWHVAEKQLITCGFSAGGHLSAWVGLCGENKPDGMILCYPGVELYAPAHGTEHNILLEALLGKGFTEAEAEALNLVNHVGPDAIPMFLWSTAEDVIVTAPPVMRFATAYATAKRSFELHIYQYGEHGLALADHVTANERRAMAEPIAAGWLDASVAWIHRNFAPIELVDKPHEMIPGLFELS